MVTPYARLNEAVEGLDYTAHLTAFKTFCFTDWMGTKPGLTAKSPIYKQVFKSFVTMVDETTRPEDPARKTSIVALHQMEAARRSGMHNVSRMQSSDVVTGTL